MVGAEFLEQFVELDQRLGDDIAVAVIVPGIVDILDGQPSAIEV